MIMLKRSHYIHIRCKLSYILKGVMHCRDFLHPGRVQTAVVTDAHTQCAALMRHQRELQRNMQCLFKHKDTVTSFDQTSKGGNKNVHELSRKCYKPPPNERTITRQAEHNSI